MPERRFAVGQHGISKKSADEFRPILSLPDEQLRKLSEWVKTSLAVISQPGPVELDSTTFEGEL